MSDFVHLHNHSEYSLLDGLSRVEDMVDRAKELGFKSLAITDHGNMYGTIHFYQLCLKAGIKPIIGCEIYVTKNRHEKGQGSNDYNHLILLAKNQTGYKNLIKIVTASYLEGFYYKPRTDIELLEKYSEGLICLTACLNGYVSEPLRQDDEKEAEARLTKLQSIYKDGNLYLELQRHINLPEQEVLNEKLIELSRKFGVPLVATNDNHYVKSDDAEAHDILLCIGTQTTVDTPNRKLKMIDSPDFYLKSTDEMVSAFAQYPEAIENSVKIADQCNLEIELGKWKMPIFDVPDGHTSESYLKELVEERKVERYPEITSEIQERIDYELSVITNKGYETYFLVVQDFVNWAKSNGISVGPGRGSAAGSVVSYILHITDIDPFYFNLPFERFLNPERPSAPDIDLDFADTRREEVIKYVTDKYGHDKVAQIITFGNMEAKGAVRDAGRALGMPYAAPDRISKMIPPGWQGHAMTIENALQQSPELRTAHKTEPDTKKLLDVAQKLEGVARHASIHAAGVVIADKPLTEYVPLQKETNGEKIVTQYDMYTVGEDGVGLLKMDFLGLRNLTIIEETLKFIKVNQGEEIELSKLPLDDKKTYDLLSEAETTGIFQLESAGMRRYIKELKPTNIFDLMAMVALYRPGPMAAIPEFIARKHGKMEVTYPDPRLEEILKPSYGILAFQDDVLLTSIIIAGYSWLDADKFRKAMGKKIPEEMKKQRELFISGAVKNGLDKKKAEEMFDLIAPFAGYGFNKAHASCYATIAYRTAYLKANYPVEFMTALLTAETRASSGPAKNEKISQAIAECKRLNINVLPPSVNHSAPEFTIENNTKIRFGLSAIKNVGSAAINAILEAREDGPFKTIVDFASRVDLSKVNKKTIESLVKAGAMDEFGKRAMILDTYPIIIEKINKKAKLAAKSQVSLFGEEEEEEDSYGILTTGKEFTDQEKLMFEKELLGFFLTGHPMSHVMENLTRSVTHTIEDLREEKAARKVKTGGMICSIKRIFTKKSNAEMAFITIEDQVGRQMECVVFPKTYENNKQYLLQDSIVLINGSLDFKDEQPVVLVENLQKFYNI